jgi:UDP-N-acetylbacillosamine N-acetyltransferase
VEAVRLFVVGAGGHGQDVADIARACGYEPVFLDDRDQPGVVGRPHELKGRDWPHVIAVNDPRERARMAVGSEPVTLVHPTAVVSESADVMIGAVIGAGTVIGPATMIGDHSHVGAGCTITRTYVGAYCSIGPGVDIAGDCVIDAMTFVGVGARVANLTNIGSGCTIGAGAVVVRDVFDGETVATKELAAL